MYPKLSFVAEELVESNGQPPKGTSHTPFTRVSSGPITLLRTSQQLNARCKRLSLRGLASIEYSTHEVFNQSMPLQDFNSFTGDPVLKQCIERLYSSSDQNAVSTKFNDFGEQCCSKVMLEHATTAEKNVPRLRQFDSVGQCIHVIDYNPSYHTLMDLSLGAGCVGFRHTGNVSQHHVA